MPMPWNPCWTPTGACDERRHRMSGNGYLFAAYAATWIIHITYLGTLVRRYHRLSREIEELKKK